MMGIAPVLAQSLPRRRLILAAVAVLAAAGCGSGGSGPTAAASVDPAGTASPSARSPETVRIAGLVLPVPDGLDPRWAPADSFWRARFAGRNGAALLAVGGPITAPSLEQAVGAAAGVAATLLPGWAVSGSLVILRGAVVRLELMRSATAAASDAAPGAVTAWVSASDEGWLLIVVAGEEGDARLVEDALIEAEPEAPGPSASSAPTVTAPTVTAPTGSAPASTGAPTAGGTS